MCDAYPFGEGRCLAERRQHQGIVSLRQKLVSPSQVRTKPIKKCEPQIPVYNSNLCTVIRFHDYCFEGCTLVKQDKYWQFP